MRPVERIGATFVGNGRAVTLDATLRESTALRAHVTEHEVEDGAPVVDHVRIAPITLTLDVIATTTPLSSALGAASATRDRDTREAVEAMFRARVPIEVRALGGVFTDMVIESIDSSTDARTGEAWAPTITLKQIRRASREYTDVPPAPLAPETDRGTQTTTEETDTAGVVKAGAEGLGEPSMAVNVARALGSNEAPTPSQSAVFLASAKELF